MKLMILFILLQKDKIAHKIFSFFQLSKWSFRNNRTITTYNGKNMTKKIDIPNNADVVIIGN